MINNNRVISATGYTAHLEVIGAGARLVVREDSSDRVVFNGDYISFTENTPEKAAELLNASTGKVQALLSNYMLVVEQLQPLINIEYRKS